MVNPAAVMNFNNPAIITKSFFRNNIPATSLDLICRTYMFENSIIKGLIQLKLLVVIPYALD